VEDLDPKRCSSEMIEPMVYRQVALGMNVSHSGAGKVFWFHDACALKFGIVAGNNPEKTDEQPPEDTKCYVCGKLLSQEPAPSYQPKVYRKRKTRDQPKT
jgi:hypothetical protein